MRSSGCAASARIAGDDLAAHRTVDIGGGLDGFDDGTGLAGVHCAADVRHLDEHQIAERGLRVVGYADRDRTVSCSRRTHSWLLVYRKSLGMLLNVNPP